MTIRDTGAAGQTRRLQLILILMIAWEALSLLAELSFGSFLFEVRNNQIDGILAARAGFGGVNIVPAVLYIYALARGPLRYRGVLWLGVLQHAVAVLLCVYHVATNSLHVENVAVTFAVSAGFVVLLLLHMPRGQTS